MVTDTSQTPKTPETLTSETPLSPEQQHQRDEVVEHLKDDPGVTEEMLNVGYTALVEHYGNYLSELSQQDIEFALRANIFAEQLHNHTQALKNADKVSGGSAQDFEEQLLKVDSKTILEAMVGDDQAIKKVTSAFADTGDKYSSVLKDYTSMESDYLNLYDRQNDYYILTDSKADSENLVRYFEKLLEQAKRLAQLWGLSVQEFIDMVQEAISSVSAKGASALPLKTRCLIPQMERF